jgi:hypothetical protein
VGSTGFESASNLGDDLLPFSPEEGLEGTLVSPFTYFFVLSGLAEGFSLGLLEEVTFYYLFACFTVSAFTGLDAFIGSTLADDFFSLALALGLESSTVFYFF